MNRTTWSQAGIEFERKEIKIKVQAWMLEGGDEYVLKRIMDSINELNASTSIGRLKLYILGMYGLISHRDSGLLTTAQHLKLADLCRTALRAQKIEPGSSQLGYMYSDIYAILGQIAAGQGSCIGGIWNQLSGSRFLRFATPETHLFHQFTSAQRLLRLGMMFDAKKMFTEILHERNQASLSPALYGNSILNLLVISRLNLQFDEAEHLSSTALSNPALTEEVLLEVQWEAFRRETIATKSIELMTIAVAKNGTHQKPIYVLDMALWDLAVGESDFSKEGRSLANISARNRKVYRKLGPVFDIAEALQNLTNHEIDATQRLDEFGNHLELISAVRRIDQELLIWLGGCRALKRAKLSKFASPCAFEYEQLSMRISNGRNRDLLNMTNLLRLVSA